MKLPVNEAKLPDLWARNFATSQQILVLKFAFATDTLRGLSKKRATES